MKLLNGTGGIGTAVIWVAAVTLVNPPAHAVTVYDNGPTSYAYGIEMSSFLEADDFVLPSKRAITGVRFWTLEGFGIRPGSINFDGHIDYHIYDSNENHPGDVELMSGSGVNINRVAMGLQERFWGSMFAYRYDFDFETPFVALGNERYYLGLHLLDSYPDPFGEIYWSTADGPLRFGPSNNRRDGVGVWVDNSSTVAGGYGAGHLAFQLIFRPVPEPSTLALAAFCALGLLVAARRNR